jgi:hypothetical protein
MKWQRTIKTGWTEIQRWEKKLPVERKKVFKEHKM